MVILLMYAHKQVFVNPFGGKGSGVQTWEQVAPLFEKAKIDLTVVFIFFWEPGNSSFCICSTHANIGGIIG